MMAEQPLRPPVGVDVTAPGAPSFATGQVTFDDSPAVLIAAARAGRRVITIINSGTTAAYIGGLGVTALTGALLPGVVGASLVLAVTGAVYGITASGSCTVSFVEEYA
jgi:hypothetical protein